MLHEGVCPVTSSGHSGKGFRHRGAGWRAGLCWLGSSREHESDPAIVALSSGAWYWREEGWGSPEVSCAKEGGKGIALGT
jgi:hypothetical protein